MERGYIKLWRVIDQNELLENDNTALIVFIKLLTRVDRRTGSYTTGRKKLATMCNLNPNTLYSALKRLEASTIIQQQSNKASTTIYICNWWKYQQDDNKPSNGRQSTVNTKQEKKENIDTKVSINKAKTPSTEINELFDYWEETFGYRVGSNIQKNRYAASNLIKKYGLLPMKETLPVVKAANLDKFSGIKIYDFVSLQSSSDKLKQWRADYGKKNTTAKKGVVIR